MNYLLFFFIILLATDIQILEVQKTGHTHYILVWHILLKNYCYIYKKTYGNCRKFNENTDSIKKTSTILKVICFEKVSDH